MSGSHSAAYKVEDAAKLFRREKMPDGTPAWDSVEVGDNGACWTMEAHRDRNGEHLLVTATWVQAVLNSTGRGVGQFLSGFRSENGAITSLSRPIDVFRASSVGASSGWHNIWKAQVALADVRTVTQDHLTDHERTARASDNKGKQ